MGEHCIRVGGVLEDHAPRFHSKVDRSGGPDACWPWLGGVSRKGYGIFYYDDGSKGAHQCAYTLSGKVVSRGLVLDHTCHNADSSCPGGDTCRHRRCVNPRHLEPVLASENRIRGRMRFTHCPDCGGDWTFRRRQQPGRNATNYRVCNACRRRKRNEAKV